jgi:hypothetical protein
VFALLVFLFFSPSFFLHALTSLTSGGFGGKTWAGAVLNEVLAFPETLRNTGVTGMGLKKGGPAVQEIEEGLVDGGQLFFPI